jgi:hypothetical protein
MTSNSEFKAGSIKVKYINETEITPDALTINDGKTVTLTALSLSSNGPFTISNATLGATTGVTVPTSENSTKIATTAYVKAQLYATTASLSSYALITSLAEYAKMAVSQTWAALQTFSSGIATNLLNATTATSAMTIGSNLTTGTLTIGTSTSSTTLNGNTAINSLSAPITPAYSYPISSGKIGYTISVESATAINVGEYDPRNLGTLSVPPGVWGTMGHTRISSTGSPVYSLVCISNASNTFNTLHMSHNQPTGTNFSTNINVSGIITNSSSSNVNWYLVGIMGYPGNFTNNFFYIVKLA